MTQQTLHADAQNGHKVLTPTPGVTSSGVTLPDLIAQTPACVLRPKAFFVAWHGVLTLAYSGFPAPLVRLKQRCAESLGALPAEAPGSRWPKTSLAALKDGKRLTPQQLATLQSICDQCSEVLEAPASWPGAVLLVDRLSLVMYQCRSLQSRIATHCVHTSPAVEDGHPAEAEQRAVAAVLAERTAPDYWVKASEDGCRSSHYTGTALGATLVHDLACFQAGGEEQPWSVALPGIIRAFASRVEMALPGMYDWFDEGSLHVTIRGIMG